MYLAIRLALTIVYLVAIIFALGWQLDPGGASIPFPMALVLYTISYSLLMALLFAHERYPRASK